MKWTDPKKDFIEAYFNVIIGIAVVWLIGTIIAYVFNI